MLKEHELSAVALQPSTDKNGIQDEYNIYEKGEIKTCKTTHTCHPFTGRTCLHVFFKWAAPLEN